MSELSISTSRQLGLVLTSVLIQKVGKKLTACSSPHRKRHPKMVILFAKRVAISIFTI
jgi:hypothetical protein